MNVINVKAYSRYKKIVGKFQICTMLVAPAMIAAAQSGETKPNIILILADDLGYGDLGIHGLTQAATPNIDNLARNGIRFTNAYVSAMVCSPSRAGLMTGRYQTRFGHEFNHNNDPAMLALFGLPTSETTLGERMKTMGYKTMLLGKWHLGVRKGTTARERGFDEYFSFPMDGHRYFLPPDLPDLAQHRLYRNDKPITLDGYLTDAQGIEAADFIQRNRDNPFFLYAPLNAVHVPLQAREDIMARFPDVTDVKRKTLLAMLVSLDNAVGTITAKVKELGLEEKTIIIFLSDNGGHPEGGFSYNTPLRGRKGQPYEGGIHVPFFVQWKGHIPAGQVSDALVISLDIVPTAVVAAGGKVLPEWKLDGKNLLPLMTQQTTERPHQTLFWRSGFKWAVRDGDWKLLSMPVNLGGSGQMELYNLATDISETHNLTAEKPEIVNKLKLLYDAWNSEQAAPLWPEDSYTN